MPYVERLQDTKKNLQHTVHDACTVRIISYIDMSYTSNIINLKPLSLYKGDGKDFVLHILARSFIMRSFIFPQCWKTG